MPDQITVANSTILISLEASDQLFILEQLYGLLYVPEAVAQEWQVPVPPWIVVEKVQNQALVQSLRLELGAGEAEAIALAQEKAAYRLILDDKKARKIARQLQLPVTGTLAILVRAKEQGIIQQVQGILESLQRVGFYVSADLVIETLRSAGE